jgi:hypothetical protein
VVFVGLGGTTSSLEALEVDRCSVSLSSRDVALRSSLRRFAGKGLMIGIHKRMSGS